MGGVRVIATAGHVDHGKSSLIVQLTGMDPDRWAEEKRRGLTIDLGYAWCTLPSGREVGFVDVPGHERFITNMLAGVGPVPLALFVVAADEGWRPQSEEHLQILDVFGVRGAVVALTRCDLVEDDFRRERIDQVREQLRGTTVSDAPVLAVSSLTGEGMDALRSALDAMLDAADGTIQPERTRLFVDRVFSIKGSGTVVTGTLVAGYLEVGQTVEIDPSGTTAKIRGLQTHGRSERSACAVSRVAANLSGIDRDQISRGDVLTDPGTWRSTDVIEAVIRPVRGLDQPIGSRGAFKVYAGAAQADARVRFLDPPRLAPGEEAFVRVRLNRPLVVDVFDRFVLREAGRGATIAGGTVLDVAPPQKPGADAVRRLEARRSAGRDDLPGLLATERGAVRADEAASLTGSSAAAGQIVGEWIVRPGLIQTIESALVAWLEAHHRDHPLEEGADIQRGRAIVADTLRRVKAPPDPDLVDTVLRSIHEGGTISTSATMVKLTTHRVSLDQRDPDIDRLLEALGGEHEATPPTINSLVSAGHARPVIEAAARQGLLVKISSDLVMTPAFVERATTVVRSAPDGITVSAFREALGTSRKYAVPLLEYLDRTGVTRREGDLRYPR